MGRGLEDRATAEEIQEVVLVYSAVADPEVRQSLREFMRTLVHKPNAAPVDGTSVPHHLKN